MRVTLSLFIKVSSIFEVINKNSYEVVLKFQEQDRTPFFIPIKES